MLHNCLCVQRFCGGAEEHSCSRLGLSSCYEALLHGNESISKCLPELSECSEGLCEIMLLCKEGIEGIWKNVQRICYSMHELCPFMV